MKTISIFLLFFLILFITSYCARAQSMTPQVINVTGESGKKAQFYFDWSLGESTLISKMQNTDSSILLTNGLLQPILNMNPSKGKPTLKLGTDEVNLLPNPTYDDLKVTVKPRQKGQVRIALYNLKGGLLFMKEYPSSLAVISETVPMSHLINGNYSLRIELDPEKADPRASTYMILKINK